MSEEKLYVISEERLKRFENGGYFDVLLTEIRSRPLSTEMLKKENLNVAMVAAYESGLKEGARKAREKPREENRCTDIENCDEICQHSRIYSPVQMQQSIAQAREQFAALIMRESPDTMQATELDGDLHAWNGETIMRVLNRLAQPEPKERDPE